MRDKIAFLGWLFNDIKGFDWWFASLLIQQLVTAVLMFTLPSPYDLYAVWYQLSLVSVGGLYFFVVYPLREAYKNFLRTK